MEAQQQEIHGQVPRIGLMTEAPPPIPEPIRRDEITGFDDVFVRFPLSGIWGDGRNRRYYRIHQNPRQLLLRPHPPPPQPQIIGVGTSSSEIFSDDD